MKNQNSYGYGYDNGNFQHIPNETFGDDRNKIDKYGSSYNLNNKFDL